MIQEPLLIEIYNQKKEKEETSKDLIEKLNISYLNKNSEERNLLLRKNEEKNSYDFKLNSTIRKINIGEAVRNDEKKEKKKKKEKK